MRTNTASFKGRAQIPALMTKRQPFRVDPGHHNFQVNSTSPANSNLVSPKKKPHTSALKQRPHIVPPQPDVEPTRTKRLATKNHTNGASSSLQTPTDFQSPRLDLDSSLDEFFSKAANLPLNQAIESFFKHHFGAKHSIVWQEIPDLQILYNETTKMTNAHSSGLVGYTFFSRKVVRTPNGPSHPSFHPPSDEKICPHKAPVMIFPLWDWKNNINYIVEIVKPIASTEFSQEDEDFVEWFTKKFKMVSRWLKQTKSVEPLTLEILQLMQQDQFLTKARRKISDFFECRQFEIWKMELSSEKITRYTDKIEIIESSQAGIVGDSLSRRQILNSQLNRLHNSYNQDIDGPDEAILSVPVMETDGQFLYALVLRGSKKASLFTKEDEEIVKKSAPVILLAFSNAETFSQMDKEYQDSRAEREGLGALLEVVEIISSQLDTNKLTDVIMEKGRMLTNADRCSLFLVNEQRDRLITSLHQGLDNCIDIPINKGIAGKTVMEGRILNIADAYDTDFFDSSTDLESGYRTRSILSVPIYNNRGKIIGVTEMVNKNDEKPFTQWDQKLIQIFNVFCGISLENAQLYRESMDTAKQLRSFFDTAFSLVQSKSVQRVISDILQNAKNTIGADKASLFLTNDENNILSSFITDCEKMPPSIPMVSGIASLCAKNNESYIVNDAYMHPHFNRAIDNVTEYKTKSILAVPILSSDGTVIGVTEILNKKHGDFLKKDMKTLQAFSAFASIALENSRLKDIAVLGDVEIEMKKWIYSNERNSYIIPKNLELSDEQKERVSTLNCYAVDFKGIGHFKELFYFFNTFKILETFKISNEVFFRFIFTISSTYNNVPYHNWTHACDVSQYVFYEITKAGLLTTFTAFEIFGLMTAAVCHDANHEGFNNIFNVKAETPFGILFKDKSVMEMHHITVSIPILTRDDINLFHSLNSEETKKMWNLFINLILATDMANHFALVKNCQGQLDEGKWNLEDPANRLLALQLLLKVADISNVSRPFELADKWCDILNNEFFRQGDLEKETGIGLTSPLNDRENSDKPKSQIGFYNFICLPLYQAVARAFPPLQANVDSINSNLAVWKSMMPPPPAEQNAEKK
ncbi:3'5'-cyclic nucleotide phosphodiesterase family protein [Tritrichomonas foetus]|uniref:3'5'-cyclic nucleotide phosphodiesterase family protein n=1 Tax=Tritrichomonas foetus TaxID=1144522 RepID=A0A1J4JT02_9EUKA|nr:3'5'-cyclic nucleotide phosphodiesterase family protein [Tritrichomonas foetus]|eukprot:OHT02203.1 3'5'-cyclic nucleotide phosphodiesterase family protein [Tritrichomonas foetus]